MRRCAAAILIFGAVLTACGPSGDASNTERPDDGIAPAPPVTATTGAGAGTSASQGPVPVDFQRSRDGAVAAATSYLAALHQLVGTHEAGRRDALRVLAADGADAVVTEALAAFATLDDVVAEARQTNPGARLFLREVPVAYTIAQYTDDRARIEVWSLGLLIVEGVTQATEVWSTNTVELVWDGDDWRVWSWERSPGPQPAAADVDPTPATEVLDTVESWEGFQYVPAAS